MSSGMSRQGWDEQDQGEEDYRGDCADPAGALVAAEFAEEFTSYGIARGVGGGGWLGDAPLHGHPGQLRVCGCSRRS